MESPPRIHVLVVDDDPLSLIVLERMLLRCQYQVTTCTRVAAALQLLREHTNTFDLVMSDVYMPDADGFKLLEIVGLEMDIPVIMMSANGETSVVMKGITHGACDYLIKPIRMEELKTIWQHVVRRKGTKDIMMKSEAPIEEVSISTEDSMEVDSEPLQYPVQNDNFTEERYDNMNIARTVKRTRVKWSAQLHEKFVLAVNELGINKAAPKKVLELMDVPGLTREHVASHLQKYRLTLKRLSTIPSPTALDRPGSGMLTHSWQQNAKMSYSIPARGHHSDLENSLARISTTDGEGMEAMGNFRPSVTQQRMAANRAQVFGGLGLSTHESNPFAHSTTGGLHRTAAKGSFLSPASGSVGGGDGGGLFRMGSLDIGLLLKMQQEEEEMEQLHKDSCKGDMEDFPSPILDSSKSMFPMTPAGGQRQAPRPSQKLTARAAQSMLPMPAPSLISTTQQVSGGTQARKRMIAPTSMPSHPFSDINASMYGYTHHSMNRHNPGMAALGQRPSSEFTMEQTAYTSKPNNDMQASPSSSTSTIFSNSNSSPGTFSTSSPCSNASFDSSEWSTAGGDVSSFLPHKPSHH